MRRGWRAAAAVAAGRCNPLASAGPVKAPRCAWSPGVAGVHRALVSSEALVTFPLGQPHPTTHPHLCRDGEINPGITAEEFAQRRNKFFDALPNRSVAVVPGSELRWHGHDVFYNFRQGPDLQWLCGLQEPGAVAVFDNRTKEGRRFTLFVPPKNRARELWDGPRAGVAGAVHVFGADDARSNAANAHVNFVNDIIDDPLCEHLILDTAPGVATAMRPISEHWGHRHVSDSKLIVERLRIMKSPAELALMREAAVHGAEAHKACMRAAKNARNEYELAALYEYECKRRGSQRIAFPTIAAGGNNATTLHYVNNNDLLRQGDLFMLDAGCEYHGYCSDITRAYPVSGKFSEAQREIYELVLEANEVCIAELAHASSKTVSLATLQNLTQTVLRAGLIRLGFDIPRELVHELYPHMIGHYLGLDTHDTHSVRKDLPLKPGIVVTIEPGIYIPQELPESMWRIGIPEKYRGIGLRIEDDVLVTADGYEVLSAGVPKTVAEIEEIMAN